MELIYVCKICGKENKIEAEKLLASKELVCESCQHHSSLTAGNEAPNAQSPLHNLTKRGTK